MERSRHASHLASRSYRGGIPDLGGGDEVTGAGGDGGGVGAAVSGASAMAEGFATRGDGPTRFGDGGGAEAEAEAEGADRRRQRGGVGVGCSRSRRGMLDANALPFLGPLGCQFGPGQGNNNGPVLLLVYGAQIVAHGENEGQIVKI
jgi:hypothetical protein